MVAQQKKHEENAHVPPVGVYYSAVILVIHGLEGCSCATGILNTAHQAIKITDPVVRPARN